MLARARRRERHQPAHGVGEPRSRARLEQLAEHDERDDRARRFEVEVRAVAARELDERRQPRDAGAERNQRVHVRRAVPHRRRAAHEVAPARPQHDERAERGLRVRAPRRIDRHRQRDERHREDERGDRVAAQPGDLVGRGTLDRIEPLPRTLDRSEHGRGPLVAALADRVGGDARARDLGIERDARARQRQVDVRGRDARHARDRALDPAHARGARHPQHGQVDRLAGCYRLHVITTLRITGMTCNGCVRHVDKALRAIANVTAVEVSLPDRAKVVHDGADRGGARSRRSRQPAITPKLRENFACHARPRRCAIGTMKLFRILAVTIAIAIPAAALASRMTSSSADCCDGGACCHPGCPLCHHGK